MGSNYCSIATKFGVFLLGDMTAGSHSSEKPQPKWQAQGKLNLLPKYFAFPPFGCCVLSGRAVVSFGAKFNNRDSTSDKTLHVKEGGGGLSFDPYRRVTLLRG